MNNISGEPQPKSLSRKEFLQGACIFSGIAIITALGGREYLRNIFEKDRKIDMSLFTSGISGTDEKRINYELFHMVFPELITKEKDGFSFINDDEKQLVLDFSNLAGEKIKLAPNKVNVALSNVSWEDAKKEQTRGEVIAGLICRGNFAICGDINEQPEFISDDLHRSIMFIGKNSESCKVEDIKLTGLKSFHQSSESDFNVPSPSYITADDANLEVSGVFINHIVSKPEEINETNAQLTKGISVHNTKNNHPLKLKIHASRIDGLEWDAIYTNGDTRVDINKAVLIQDKVYKHIRGAAIGSTFNSTEGKVNVRHSEINYSKGVGIWTDAGGKKGSEINLILDQCNISVSSWCVNMDPEQRAQLKQLKITLDWGDTPTEELRYWPIESRFKGERLGLNFDTLEYTLDPKRTGGNKLMVFANFDDYDNFQNVGLSEFIKSKIDNFGEIIVNLPSKNNRIDKKPEKGKRVILTKNKLIKALDQIEKSSQENLNPSGMMFYFDLDKEMFIVLIANQYDTESGSIYFTDPFWINQDGEIIENVEVKQTNFPAILNQKNNNKQV